MSTVLILLAVLLIVTAIVQILTIYDLVSVIKGKNNYEISDADNRTQATLFLIFILAYLFSVGWQINKWGGFILPESASVHGEDIDRLMNVTLLIISIVFVVTHLLLGWFVYKGAGSKSRRSLYLPHNNKLEVLWTVIPATGLTIIILYGLTVWNRVMSPLDTEDKIVIELYAKQFDWTARYAGKDGRLGRASVYMIEGANALGIDSSDVNANDDIIVKGEFHIPVGKPVEFRMRSQDVIHSAYMPHFRAQMNCVPGMTTTFHFTPKYTTAEMREKLADEKFDYVLLCNKICGAAHYNMQMKIVVETEEEYNKWLETQPAFIASK